MRGIKALLTAGALAAFVAAWAPVAAGRSFEVTRHNDPNPGACKPDNCSLREAVLASNAHSGPDAVVLPDRRGSYKLGRPNVPLGADEDASLRGDLDLTGRMTLRHPGRGKATIDANGIDRVLEVLAPTEVARIKLTGGDNPSGGDGGGILAQEPLTLTRSSVVGNEGAEHGGGIEAFPLVKGDTFTLRLIRSKVARNANTTGLGGGIDTVAVQVRLTRSKVIGNEAGNSGGGVTLFEGDLEMNRSTVAGNRSGPGPAGVYLTDADASIRNSTISGNTPDTGSDGGGIESNRVLEVVNSTVAGNSATNDGGGIIIESSDGALFLSSSTVVRNLADSDGTGGGAGGGIRTESGASAEVVNSIIALNRSNGPAPVPDDCSGAFDTGGGNLLSTGNGCNLLGFPARPDIIDPNPKLGRLARNGGPTQTVALKKGSPAIGKAVKAAAPKRDQRGVKRDSKPDIGAFER